VYWYFKTWNAAGVTDRIHDALRAAVRDADGRDPMASAGIVDAQSVKGADTVGSATRGYDAGKKVNGRKRHVVTDTLGLLVVVLVTAANVQDRAGAQPVLIRAKMAMPSIALVWADGGSAGKLIAWVAQHCRILVQIVRKPEGQRTFEVLPRRWVVERTLCAARRLVVSPAQPGGIWREVPGSNGSPDAERLGDNSMPENPAAGASGQGRRAGGTRVIWRKLDCLKPNLQLMQVLVHREDR
jgi:transposase